MSIKVKAKKVAVASAVVGTALFYFSCGTSKNNSATTLEDSADSSSATMTSESLKEFVNAATKIRESLASEDKDAVESALRDLGRDITNQEGAAFANFIGRVTANDKIAESNRLIEETLKTIAEATNEAMDLDKDVGLNPLLVPGVFNKGERVLLLDLVKKPNNTNKYALWESVLSTNPFDLLALAQDSKAQLVHVEQYIPQLADIVKGKPEGQRVGVIGKTAFITLSADDSSESGLLREARGVCSDLESVNGMASGMETKRTFSFVTPTLANAARPPTLGEDRSPRIGLVQPGMTSTDFMSMVRQGCFKQSNQGGANRAVKLAYEVVAAFNITGLGTYRILAADLRFGPAGDTNFSDQRPARLYWLQRAISNVPAAIK